MKHIAIFILFAFTFSNLEAIDFKIGVMAGANSSLNQLYTYGDILKSDSKLGYNLLAFTRFKISSYIIQPECGYQMNRIGFTSLEGGLSRESNFNLSQFHISVLMGLKLSKFRFAIGPMALIPSAQNFESINTQETIIQQINDGRIKLGMVANVALDISKRWSVDLRACRTFTQSEFIVNKPTSSFNFLGNTGVLSLMVGYTLFKTK